MTGGDVWDVKQDAKEKGLKLHRARIIGEFSLGKKDSHGKWDSEI